MTAFHTPDSYLLKLGRAKEHLKALNRHVSGEFKSGDRVFDAQVNEDLSVIIITCASGEPDPAISLIAADCIANVRACLDHLISQIVVRHRETRALDRQAFPICDTHDIFSRNVCGEDLKEVPFKAIAAIESFQPYDRKTGSTIGDHVLIAMKRLSNTDKHRALYVATRDLRDFDITILINGVAQPTIKRRGPFHPGAIILKKPIKASPPKDKVEVNAKAVLRIAFKESPVKGVVVNKLLGKMIDHIETTVIPGLKPFAH